MIIERLHKMTLFIIDYCAHWRIVFFIDRLFMMSIFIARGMNLMIVFFMVFIGAIMSMNTMMILMFLTVTHLFNYKFFIS